ncbi:hypothetical protein CsatB_011970 [Cannabis sativa]|uniref:X8 domain-containing protein n=1 Tax=Cannabis sativa TaxID=3483 RepID=A0A7J6GV80_CANSA|nr:glucan endo-1,3-beta-D-glucosidase [Cannabis sativa]XP_030487802.1 glucan endo-1,3-beta-D-glucosidase [Cannabis sativa]KAF4386832.1 hypothetical protein F8388_006787 [Cannabis sativa]KAF4397908.1 hypothetical protein G4B88_019629 [Cannabis sativa]
MANKAALALPLWLLLLSFTSETLLMVHGQEQKTWCVAKPSTEAAALQGILDYACSQVDCSIMEKGCPCSLPDNLINRASIAMNLYYQANGRNRWNCIFRNSALVVVTDPSYGKCIYA